MSAFEVVRLIPGGEAVVRAETGTVLVPGGVPGDQVRIERTGRRRGAERGRVLEVLRASPDRVTPPCPHADTCGGCVLQHVSTGQQATLKSTWVEEAFRELRESDTSWTPAEPVSLDDPGALRRRVRWKVGADAAGPYLGFQERASHQVVRQSQCPVTHPALLEVRQWLEAQPWLEELELVQATALSDGLDVVLEGAAPPSANDWLDRSAVGPVQWWWRETSGVRPLQRPVRALGDRVVVGAKEVTLAIGPEDFVQGQQTGNRMLIEQVQTWVGDGARLADLFCGVGNLSLPVAAKSGAEVHGADVCAASVRAATRNAKSLGVEGDFEQANLFDRFDTSRLAGMDAMIIDPPRKGARRVCKGIGTMAPRRVILVSCDVAAGARDGALLRSHGYHLRALRALDLFPHTGHIETLGLWVV